MLLKYANYIFKSVYSLVSITPITIINWSHTRAWLTVCQKYFVQLHIRKTTDARRYTRMRSEHPILRSLFIRVHLCASVVPLPYSL